MQAFLSTVRLLSEHMMSLSRQAIILPYKYAASFIQLHLDHALTGLVQD